MKKILSFVLILLFLFVAIIYISTHTTSKTTDTIEIIGYSHSTDIDFKKHKYIKVAASNLYKSNMLKDFIQGENYREAWSTPITVPIVYLDTFRGGLEIVKEGGGHQTKSLRLKDKSGIYYTMRSINKDPDPLIPEFLKTVDLQNIVVDGISAQHPYGATVAAKLSENADLLHTHPRVVFIPKQDVLDEYNTDYGNRLYHLEYETKSERNWTSLSSISKIVDTEDLLKMKMKLKDNLKIDKSTLIRARLFDIMIGDWDRHAKQWGWAIKKQNDKYTAIPIATDRDNAFFSIDGLLPTIISNKNIEPKVRPFENEIDFLDGLVYDFDVYFLQNVPLEVYLEEAKKLQNDISDIAIEKALRVWNDDLYNLNAVEISEKIKSRRQNLIETAKKFKNIIDSRPLLKEPLRGSDKNDINDELISCFDCN